MSGTPRRSRRDPEPEKKFFSHKLDRTYDPPNAYDLYNKRTERVDDEFIEHCNQSMDSLLVFVRIPRS
jgi:hypothetical protein